jgi:plasmid stabilization system protein ParE
VSYKLTKKAEADLSALIDFSLERFGSETALRHLASWSAAAKPSIAAISRGPS